MTVLVKSVVTKVTRRLRPDGRPATAPSSGDGQEWVTLASFKRPPEIRADWSCPNCGTFWCSAYCTYCEDDYFGCCYGNPCLGGACRC